MKKVLLPIALGLMILIPAPVICGAVLACDGHYHLFTVEEAVRLEPQEAQFGLVNVLLTGTDQSGACTDVILLFSFDSQNKTIRLLSIPRDTKISYNGKTHKINSAYAYGKEDFLIEQVNKLTGVQIHYFAKVDLNGFRAIIDALGGVDFDVPADLFYRDPYQNLTIDLKKGMQHLDGKSALDLLRFRRYPEGDIQRIAVQQDFLRELIKQKLTPGLINQAPLLFTEISKYVKTNFTINDFIKYRDMLTPLSNGEIETYTLPGTAQDINRVSYFLADTQKAKALIQEKFTGI